MDFTHALSESQLIPTLALAGVVVAILGVFFGYGRRTIAGACLVALALNVLYPGGSAALVVDALRPLRSLVDDTAARRDGRNADIDRAVPGR